MLPLIGPEAFSTFSEGAKYVHNFVSFPFVLALLIITMWMKDNVVRKVDIVWLKEGGGFIPSKHPTGRFNAARSWCSGWRSVPAPQYRSQAISRCFRST